jgi:hypothetical protein
MPVSFELESRVNDHLADAVESVGSAIELCRAFAALGLEGRTTDFAEHQRQIGAAVAEIERHMLTASLQALEPVGADVVIGGVAYRRLANTDRERSYLDLRTTETVSASLFRQVGVRNGPTVVPLELRAGIVEGRATPRAAVAVARLAQAVPTDEASALCEAFEALPTSGSSIYRLANRLGIRWEDRHVDGENFLAAEFEIPDKAAAVCVAIDRVNLPYAIPRELTAEETQMPKPPRNPIRVEYRQVYVGCLTITDADRKPLHTTRYGRVPDDAGRDLLEQALRYDLLALMKAQPDLKLSAVGDGAAEVQQSLDRVTAGLEVGHRGVDVWHAFGYLNKAVDAAGQSAQKSQLRETLQHQADGVRTVLVTLLTWALAAEHGGAEEPTTGLRLVVADGVEVEHPPTSTQLAIDAAVREMTELLDADVLQFARHGPAFVRTPLPDFGDHVPEELVAGVRYLWNHWERMNYAEALRLGLPIGSGHVEASCKTLVAVRMKRSGARWKDKGAQAILNLRGLATSSRSGPAMRFLLGTYRTDVEISDAA